MCWPKIYCEADTLLSAVFNVNGTAGKGTATTEMKKWSLRSETAPGQKNVVHTALGEMWNSYLPPLLIKFGLIKMSVKAMVM